MSGSIRYSCERPRKLELGARDPRCKTLRALLANARAFIHAVRKRSKAGDDRVHFPFGSTDEAVDARDEWMAGAHPCIEAAPALPASARVDGVIQNGTCSLSSNG